MFSWEFPFFDYPKLVKSNIWKVILLFAKYFAIWFIIKKLFYLLHRGIDRCENVTQAETLSKRLNKKARIFYSRFICDLVSNNKFPFLYLLIQKLFFFAILFFQFGISVSSHTFNPKSYNVIKRFIEQNL
jgi:hypothetical protein